MLSIPSVFLREGREKSLRKRHPWVFSGAIARIEGDPSSGDTVQVCSARGEFLASAAYSPDSQIRLRIWSWDADQEVGESFLCQRLQQSFALRQMLGFNHYSHETQASSPVDPGGSNAVRLVHGESDGLPGLVFDRYGDTLVMQVLSAGIERWRDVLAAAAMDLTGAKGVYERSDVDVRKLEGLPERTGLLLGEEPPEQILVQENGLNYWVDVRKGHKTGFYLDQRPNRLRVRELSRGREVLDCFCYSGGFTANALAGGAESVLAVDASAEAVALSGANLALNGLLSGRVRYLEGDVFHVLRTFRDSRLSFDMIILDPPKFAQTSSQVERATRGYKDINLLAFKLLRPGGLLVTFSCSGGVSADLFQKIVAGAALDAGVQAQILEYLNQGPDHPTALNFPEGAYLKGLVVRVN